MFIMTNDRSRDNIKAYVWIIYSWLVYINKIHSGIIQLLRLQEISGMQLLAGQLYLMDILEV